MAGPSDQKPAAGWRRRLFEVVFESDTRAGRVFDLALIWAILASVATVVLESIASVRARYGHALTAAEWAFTLLFSAEYLLRLACVRRPARYATSFLGVVDLLAVAPTYLSLLVPGSQALVVVRVLRVLRIFRVLKLTAYLRESRVLADALWAGRRKIGVFLFAVLTLLVIVGSLMYLIEGESNGFTDIPTSIYWAVVTLTTVGYGDIAPKTAVGRALSAAVMILGYSIIAVPTGIVTAELTRAGRVPAGEAGCPACGATGHDADARFCKYCGAGLPGPVQTGPNPPDAATGGD
jgi:voltage-gated potassium channel